MVIEPFKMKVSPSQSKLVQKMLFENGYEWSDVGKKIQHTNKKCLCLHYDDYPSLAIMYDTSAYMCNITWEEFEKKYVIKYLRKEKLKKIEQNKF